MVLVSEDKDERMERELVKEQDDLFEPGEKHAALMSVFDFITRLGPKPLPIDNGWYGREDSPGGILEPCESPNEEK